MLCDRCGVTIAPGEESQFAFKLRIGEPDIRFTLCDPCVTLLEARLRDWVGLSDKQRPGRLKKGWP